MPTKYSYHHFTVIEFVNCTHVAMTASCSQLGDAGKTSAIASFKDPKIHVATSLPVIDFIDSLRPGKVKYEIVTDGASEEVSLPLVIMLTTGRMCGKGYCIAGNSCWSMDSGWGTCTPSSTWSHPHLLPM